MTLKSNAVFFLLQTAAGQLSENKLNVTLQP